MTLSPEHQSAQMSKITNDGLTRSDTFRMLHSCTVMATVGVKGLRQSLHVASVVLVVFMYTHTTNLCHLIL